MDGCPKQGPHGAGGRLRRASQRPRGAPFGNAVVDTSKDSCLSSTNTTMDLIGLQATVSPSHLIERGPWDVPVREKIK